MNKQEINIDNFKQHENDTGSVELQVASLTKEIAELSSHLSSHPKDFSSKRGMIKLVAKRRKALQYLERRKPEVYKSLLQGLGLRK